MHIEMLICRGSPKGRGGSMKTQVAISVLPFRIIVSIILQIIVKEKHCKEVSN